MIIIDVRSFNGGMVDPFDYLNIAYGSKALLDIANGFLCRTWINKDGNEELIKGIFDSEHPNPNSSLIRERIHALGFIAEKNYQDGSLIKNLKIIPNPHCFSSKEKFEKVIPKEFLQNGQI